MIVVYPTPTQPISGTVTVSNLPALGQQLAAGSLPVVIASDQSQLGIQGLGALTTIEVRRLQIAAGQFGAAGFIPMEIPSFLGA